MRALSSVGLVALLTLGACTVGGVATTGADPTADPTGDPTGVETPPESSSTTETDTPPPKETVARLAANLSISEIAVLQGVKTSIVKNGALVAPSARNAPVVAGRPGLLRVYVKPGAGWKSRSVTAELQLIDGTTPLPVLKQTKTIAAASTDNALSSTFNFELSEDSLTAKTAFRVALTAADGIEVADGTPSPGRFPSDGTPTLLGARTSGTLKVVVVPVRYNADNSGRLPDVSAAALATYKQNLLKLYPTANVTITARAAMPWASTISRNGTGFSQVLKAVQTLRYQDGVADDVYYYGLFAPASTFSAFCNFSCVTGLSTLADADTPDFRASVGVGYIDDGAADTMAHELGHAHGREHAPCGGASNVDPEYPYSNGSIGAWGYDIFEKTLISPSVGSDIMAYCENQWVSDYTYTAFFKRLVAVSGASQTSQLMAASERAQQRYHVASVGMSGELEWDGRTVNAPAHPSGRTVRAHYLSDAGVEVMTKDAVVVSFDHVPGGYLLLPDTGGATWSSLRIDGYEQTLSRPTSSK